MKFGINNPAFLQMAGNAQAQAKDYFYIRSLADANEVTFRSYAGEGNFANTKLGEFADNLEYSLDGNSWSPLSADDMITLNSGESILFRNPNNTVYNLEMGTNIVKTSDEYEVGGNIIRLFYPGVELPAQAFKRAFYYDELIISASDLKLPVTTLAEFCCDSMFSRCTGLTAAPELPATTLAKSCYNSMFSDCTGLTAAPELPAMILAESCYNNMFFGCTGLTAAPELPATNLAKSCYNSMFYGCTSLTAAPELSATILAESCYGAMFSGCTGLTAAPELPATTLAESCYGAMFYDCTSLTVAPELPATTLAESCYSTMFSGCTGLTAAPKLPATTLAEYCYNSMFSGCTSLTEITCLASSVAGNTTYNWLRNVAESGTFTKAAGMEDWLEGASGIPTGWNVQDYVG